MKFSSALTFLGLAVVTLASPLESAHDKRACNTNATIACQNACRSVATAACKSCNGNPSCVTACYSARLKSCQNCCAKNCTTC
ncbi:unnamed protein product [Parascedosporium putredinis]|uniref:Uncharacterized protein n=1 Tax=Parascedosporium putredinis TaxID=1442378 RepID=A0A9P1H7V3_9PEZI|nr:unnamed protein product [Parascedosporium putredinis]CAI8000199.1 unnamed protein product [Parascedosporium putredinis]